MIMTEVLKSKYGFIHGIILSSSYALIKYLGYATSLTLLVHALIVTTVLFLPFLCSKTRKEVIKPSLVFKGITFGITQILFFECLKGTGVANIMVSALLGTTTSIILARFLVRESFSRRELFGMVVTLVGTTGFIGSDIFSFDASFYAVIAGMCQGISFTLTRTSTIDDISPVGVISSNYIFGGLAIGLWLLVNAPAKLFNTNIFFSSATYGLALIVLIAQSSLYYMMKNSDIKSSSTLSLSRLPSSYFLDFFMFSIPITLLQLVSTGVIFLGMFVSSTKSKKMKNQKVKEERTKAA